ncbi:MAG: hypothetical protein Q4C47_06715, partial [Planctomycetia bacterium]|nr:hypothetical protein [Planctomycetia bacterium]
MEDFVRPRGFRLQPDLRMILRWRETVSEEFRRAWEEAGIQPPSGTWAVRGNHDDIWGLEPPIPGVKWLRSTDAVPFRQDTLITFLSTRDSRDLHDDTIYPDYAGTSLESRFQIVVGHHPDPAENPTLRGDLFLAGHTHGGQIRIPFVSDWLRKLLNSPTFFRSGVMTALSGVDTYISRGTGIARLDSPRFRLNCPPEILSLELEPSTEPTGKEAGRVAS